MSDNIPLVDPTPTYLAPVQLPADVAKHYAAREAAYERLVDFEAEQYDVLDPMWKAHFEAIDKRNAAAAIRAGKDPFAGDTELGKAEKRRARALGARQALYEDLRAADAALFRAWSAAVPDLVPDAGAALRTAADAYRKADNAARVARDAFRQAAQVRTFLALFKAGEQREYGGGYVPRADAHARGSEEISQVLGALDSMGITDPYAENGEPDNLVNRARLVVGATNSFIKGV
ncbi:hypothetical protein OHB41_26040 [Streptomyces sp. NBC_01571]|uniref:hypothetical protein n=1 Tax=Streptomyces sp. NBC_01571 TaxID=2975883 RepID=UPI0022515412|nr:hypothetical protein [Streptomyces sp. NBC_01571]MCX4576572.1 hypothetical protein [Streptomyces sp. NBC_01571]